MVISNAERLSEEDPFTAQVIADTAHRPPNADRTYRELLEEKKVGNEDLDVGCGKACEEKADPR
ncbi:hypothetical protein CTT39_15800 [Agrobacterium rosae]|nr:hypothetical protein CTT39_15800 [Agrobacterium rosae]